MDSIMVDITVLMKNLSNLFDVFFRYSSEPCVKLKVFSGCQQVVKAVKLRAVSHGLVRVMDTL